MSIIIINIRNPVPKFKFCSVFSANTPTVYDASGVTMGEAAAVVGMIFGVPAEQQQCATCFFSPHFFQLMEIRRSDSKR